MPGRKRKFTKDDVLTAIFGSRGIVSTVAARLKCDWRTARRYIDMWEHTRVRMLDEEEANLDNAESKLMDAVDAGEPWAIKTTLHTKGRKRGYGERHEIAGVAEAPLTIVYKTVEPDDDGED